MASRMLRARHNHPWTAEADADLAARIARGDLLPDIARALERSQEAVRSRANILRLPVRSSPGRGRRVIASPLASAAEG
ncbi:hypothetical protein CLG96_08360 [Sphingomonas oleivorans]|uniref:Uncharacterized protein n=1 Tax=Sphingomonas oleivorans TaxID=1735121 RepID=A0A2T5FY39_9SPHN|nr:hypothetical protein [Sphingomonas oleivorans]PTQ11450.1 hypothetical protein CLG96_08360 [Sphingomonas oleivorans]